MIDQLPPGWAMARLGDLATGPRAVTDGPFGTNLARAHYTSTGPRVVRLQNIGDGSFIDSPAHISREHYETLEARHGVLSGDLLLASLGEPLPRACLAPSHLGPAIVKADCIRVRLDRSVDPRWVLYALQRPAARRWAADRLHGVGRLRLGLGGIREVPVPIPPPDEQRRIVAILEDHFSRLDAADQNLDQLRRKMTVLRGQLVDGATTPGSTTRLNDWRKTTLGEVASEVRNGVFVQRPTKDPTGTAILRISAVRGGSVDLSDVRFVPGRDRESLGRFLVQDGDLLVTRYNGSRALVAISGLVRGVDRAILHPDKLIRVRLAEHIVPAFINYQMAGRRVREYLEPLVRTTAGQSGISGKALRSTPLLIPSAPEQRKIASELNDLMFQLAGMEDSIQGNRGLRSANLRSALFAAAFSGRLTEIASGDDLVRRADQAEETMSRLRRENVGSEAGRDC